MGLDVGRVLVVLGFEGLGHWRGLVAIHLHDILGLILHNLIWAFHLILCWNWNLIIQIVL